MIKTIVLVGTLDTKGEEINYVKKLIEMRGLKTIVIDTSLLSDPQFPPDISREEVAKAAGTNLKEIVSLCDEGKAVTIISKGAAKVAQQLYSTNQLDGIIALGGSMGTSLGLAVMRVLPLGVPKLMVSTVSFAPHVTVDIASMDQVMMQCVADMWGLDRLTKRTLESAAAAISAMAETFTKEVTGESLIGLTTLGTAAHQYVWTVKPLLTQKGYETAVFHTNGFGGRTLEQLIEQGMVTGVLDFSAQELICNLYKGLLDAGPNRLEAAAIKGIPQVFTPGGLDLICWPPPANSIPPRFKTRELHIHNPRLLITETKNREMVEIAEVIAKKLNKSAGPTVVLIPTKGLSNFDKPGAIYYNPKRLRVLKEELKRQLEPKIQIIELDMHINDLAFAQEAVNIFDKMMQA